MERRPATASRVLVGVAAAMLSAGWPASARQEGPAVYQGAAAEDFLTRATITNVRPLGTGITRPMRVTLEFDGVTRNAVFKSIDVTKGGVSELGDGRRDLEFQDSWQTEIAAYRLDRLINLGMVPATIERRVNGTVGSLQWWVEAMMPEAQRVREGHPPPDFDLWQQRLMKVRLFDQLIDNVDRHLNNLLVTRDFDFRLIDHSRSFRPVRTLRKPDDLTRFSRSLIDGIAKLELPVLRAELGRYLTDGQIERMLQRRDAILALVRQRIAEKGEAAVMYR